MYNEVETKEAAAEESRFMPGAEVDCTAKTTRLDYQLQRFNELLGGLDDGLDRLRGRIGALSPLPPMDGPPEAPRTTSEESGSLDRLDSATDRLQEHVRSVHHLVDHTRQLI